MPLPRLRERDDMIGSFFCGLVVLVGGWSQGPASQRKGSPEAGMKAGMCKKTKQDLSI